LLAVGKDSPREHGSHSGERIQLLGRGDIDVDLGCRQAARLLRVRHSPHDRRVAGGQTVRGEPMSAAACASLASFVRHAPRRVDGGELAIEGDGILRWKLFDCSDGSQRSYRGAEQTDAGEKEQSLLFSRRWHAAILRRACSFRRIGSLLRVAKDC
jgi:hypothetical protein